MSNCLDPDQARHYVGPDLGPNCLGMVIGRPPMGIKSQSADTKKNLIHVVCFSHLLHIFADIID